VSDPRERLRLDGRRALVTGAGRGFGRRIAVDFAALGAAVAALDVDERAAEDAAREVGGLALVADVAEREQVHAAFARAEAELGGIDILVNNAGIASTTSFPDLMREEWDRVLAVDVTSMYEMCKCAVPGMRDRRFGRIVNVSSIAGKRGGGFIGRCAYATAKAAVLGFTKAVARELAAYSITANAIAPGGMDTEMTKILREDEELLAKVLAAIPLGRRGSDQDVADAAVFLVSDLADYITGETVNVDGGVLME